MRAIFLGFALLTAGASSAAAETLLDTVLYVVTGLEPRYFGNTKVTVTQDADSLDAKLVWSESPGNAGARESVGSVSLKRVTRCKFNVDFADTSNRIAHFSVDFSGADLAGAFLMEVPKLPESHALVIPGAIWCHASGRPYYKAGEPSCSGPPAVLPFFSRRDDDKMLAAVRRLKTLCSPKVSLLGESAR
ncbi:MAG TPA: hypothetical protein VLX44_12030 [Xanthobacteraceae bacterium]|nr:hypothetical protein [Xanthobacteraceae bacterium]